MEPLYTGLGPKICRCNREVRDGCIVEIKSMEFCHLGLKLGGCNNEVAASS